jgi:hypothetical protein
MWKEWKARYTGRDRGRQTGLDNTECEMTVASRNSKHVEFTGAPERPSCSSSMGNRWTNINFVQLHLDPSNKKER